MATLPPDHQDGLDSLLHELAVVQTQPPAATASPRTTTSTRRRTSTQEDWDDWEQESADKVTRPRRPTIDETQIVFYQKELREYIQDLADPFILQEIETHLANKPYASLAKYYEGKPEMAKYTVDHEVTRMAYRIVDGSAEGNGASAAAAGAAAADDAGATDGGGSNNSSSSTIPPSPPLLLAENDPLSIRAAHASHPHPFSWRLANQSLFAEILQEIQQRFIRGDLEVGVVSKDSRFVLDVGKDCVEG